MPSCPSLVSIKIRDEYEMQSVVTDIDLFSHFDILRAARECSASLRIRRRRRQRLCGRRRRNPQALQSSHEQHGKYPKVTEQVNNSVGTLAADADAVH